MSNTAYSLLALLSVLILIGHSNYWWKPHYRHWKRKKLDRKHAEMQRRQESDPPI